MAKRVPGLVFVSHASVDKQRAEVLKSWLEERFPGFIDVFVSSDLESIEMGSEWFQKITDAIRHCKAAIVLASRKSLERRWVNLEIGALNAIGKNVIPVCVGALTLPLPSPLDRLQTCIYDSVDDRLKLLRTISKNLEMPPAFTNKISRHDAEEAPPMPGEDSDLLPAVHGGDGHGVALERLFQTADRWTTIIYTCRATFTGETCPGNAPLLGKTIAAHVPVDEIQTFCTAINHLMPVAARKHEEDIRHTVICSREAERLALEFPPVQPADAPAPSLLDRDLIVIGENNFSNLLLYMAEPFQAWTARQYEEIRHANKPGRAMVYAVRTPHAQLDREPLQMNRVGEGGGMISIFPNPFNFRKMVINLYGCHREGQFTLENWLRGGEIETVVDLIAAARVDSRLNSTQIVVNRGGEPGQGHYIDPNPSSGAVPNVKEGRPFWSTRVNAFPTPEGIEPNPNCETQHPMYDISLIVELSGETQNRLREQMQAHVPFPDLYWESDNCNIGFHVTLYEFCTHDRPSPELVRELERALASLLHNLKADGGPERPVRRQAQIRGIDLTYAALIACVDFLPAHRKEVNWLETVRTWCEHTVQRMAREKVDVQRLFNKRHVPFPPHVTLCRFPKPATPELAQRIDEVTARRRYAVLAPIAIDSLSIATARRRPYQEVEIREQFALHRN
jgi:hypothetical protein